MDGLCNVPKLLSGWPFKDHGLPDVSASDPVGDSTNPIPTRCPALQMWFDQHRACGAIWLTQREPPVR